MILKLSRQIFFFRKSAFTTGPVIVRHLSYLSEGNVDPKPTKSVLSFFDHSNQENIGGRRIPLTVDDHKNLRKQQPCQPENPRILKVSILGEPNVGKSTLTNNLVKWKVCAVSRKVHTTRKKAAAVYVEGSKQIIFLDTPGLVTAENSKRHSLEPSFVMDPIMSVREADLIAVVVDISNRFTNNRINPDVLEVLENFKEKKSILVLNKIDAMKSKSRLLSLTRILTGGMVGGVKTPLLDKDVDDSTIEDALNVSNIPNTEDSDRDNSSEDHRGWRLFSNVFMVSALKSDGVDDLRQYLMEQARPGRWMYHDNTVTDQHPHEIALTTVREKLLEYLPEEIPYAVDLRICKWEILSSGSPKIHIKIICANSRHKRFVIGPNGKYITACADRARRTMREAFRKDIVLNLAVE